MQPILPAQAGNPLRFYELLSLFFNLIAPLISNGRREMNLNNLKNIQVSSIHGRDLFLPRKFDIDNEIYIESVDGFVTALFDHMRRSGNMKDLDSKKVYEKSLKDE